MCSEAGTTGSLYVCRRCNAQVSICAACDRGHVYCSAAYSRASREERCRASRRRYQRTAKGRARQRRYRLGLAEKQRQAERLAAAVVAEPRPDAATEKTVTDQSSQTLLWPLNGQETAANPSAMGLTCVRCGRPIQRVTPADP